MQMIPEDVVSHIFHYLGIVDRCMLRRVNTSYCKQFKSLLTLPSDEWSKGDKNTSLELKLVPQKSGPPKWLVALSYKEGEHGLVQTMHSFYVPTFGYKFAQRIDADFKDGYSTNKFMEAVSDPNKHFDDDGVRIEYSGLSLNVDERLTIKPELVVYLDEKTKKCLNHSPYIVLIVNNKTSDIYFSMPVRKELTEVMRLSDPSDEIDVHLQPMDKNEMTHLLKAGLFEWPCISFVSPKSVFHKLNRERKWHILAYQIKAMREGVHGVSFRLYHGERNLRTSMFPHELLKELIDTRHEITIRYQVVVQQ